MRPACDRGMHFLISDGRQRRDHHVEAVKPWPAFDEVISGGANRHDQQQKNADLSQVAEGIHEGRWSLVVSRWPLALGSWPRTRSGRGLAQPTTTDQRRSLRTHDYKTKRPSAQCGGPLKTTSASIFRTLPPSDRLHPAVLLPVAEVHHQSYRQPEHQASPVDPA